MAPNLPQAFNVHVAGAAGRGFILTLLIMTSTLLAVLTTSEAATIETFNPASCDGSPTNTFLIDDNNCQNFEDQGAVQISDISSDTRVSVHNEQGCATSSSVAQIYGPGCVVQGATKLRSVFIAASNEETSYRAQLA